MICYSADFLSKIEQNPQFTLYPSVIAFTEKYKHVDLCEYPIFQLGEYKQENEGSSNIIRVARDVFLSLGAGIAVGYGTGSPWLGITAAVTAFTASPTVRKVAETAVGFAICPAAKVGKIAYYNGKILEHFLVERQKAHAELIEAGYRVTNLRLTKGGTSYDAYFITTRVNISSRWVVHALDGNQTPDWPLQKNTFHYKSYHLYPNHCFVAGPSVGESSGWPTAHQIGAGYQMALQLLEEIGATHIVMEAKGLFAGVTVAEAVKQHPFKDGVKYLSVSISTAANLSEAAKLRLSSIGPVAEKFVSIVGMDCDLVAASRKLSERQIEQIVIQHRDEKNPFDGLLHDDAGLAAKLEENGLTKSQTVLFHPKLDHSALIFEAPHEVQQPLMERVTAFLDPAN